MGSASEVVVVDAASKVVVDACWPDDLPQNYEEMQKMYGVFIITTLRRYNKVGRNFEELHHSIWLRLVQMDVISTFKKSCAGKLPTTMTAEEACKTLGITFNQWRTKMWSYHIGVPVKDKQGRIICRRPGGWMPKPINEEAFTPRTDGAPRGYSSKQAMFQTEDIMQLASSEELTRNGKIRGPFSKQGVQELPKLQATKGYFQSYLARTIYSTFLNWCRTFRRKWSQDQPMFFQQIGSGPGDYDDSMWDRLPDERAGHQDVEVDASMVVAKLRTTFRESMGDHDGTLAEEKKMFELLQEGTPLPDVLKKLDVPDRVRKAVIRSVAELRA